MSFDLTNKNISDTFQNVLQKTGSEGHLYDLVGNKVRDLTIDGTLTANSYIVSESIVNTSSGSTAFGNTSDDSHTFQGHITASGNISASGDLYGSDLYLDGEIKGTTTTLEGDLQIGGDDIKDSDGNTVLSFDGDGNIDNDITIKSPSPELILEGTSAADSVIDFRRTLGGRWKIGLDYNGGGDDFAIDQLNLDATAAPFVINRLTENIGIGGTGASPSKPLTVQGDISASGAISTNSHITASGNISASGDLFVDKATIGDDLTIGGDSIEFQTETDGAVTIYNQNVVGQTSIISDGPGVNLGLYLSGSVAFLGADSGVSSTKYATGTTGLTVEGDISASGNIHSDGHITASGNISASGDLYLANNKKIMPSSDNNVYIQLSDTGMEFSANTNDSFIFDGSSEVNFEYQNSNGAIIYADGGADKVGIGDGGWSSGNIPPSTLTVKGDISASGFIKGNHITASGNISSSGTITASAFKGDGSGLTGVSTDPSFAWIRLEDDGDINNSTDPMPFGKGSAIVSSSFNTVVRHNSSVATSCSIQSTGTYKIMGNFLCAATSQNDVTFKVKVDGTTVHTVVSKVHSSVDPHDVNLIYVGDINSGSHITTDSFPQSTNRGITYDIGSTLFVEKLR